MDQAIVDAKAKQADPVLRQHIEEAYARGLDVLKPLEYLT